MSNTSNEQLESRAWEMMEYWVNTLWARLIQRDIDTNDLEALKYHVDQAEREANMQETYVPLEDPRV